MAATSEDLNQPLWFLKAKTAEQLHALMVANNKRFNARFHYLPPVPFKGEWYTWFEIKESVRLTDEMNDGEKKES